SKLAALQMGRRTLPIGAKRFLKRFWDPNQNLTHEEAALLAQGSASSAVGRFGAGKPARARPTRYDVVCFSIIEWDFRWQRPQQIMSRFAERGHRVFYLSPSKFLPAGGKPYQVTPLRDNVWEVQVATPRPVDPYGGELPEDLSRFLANDLRALRADF